MKRRNDFSVAVMSASFKDYYAVLGVARDATPEEIKKAFRKLAREHHPDTAADQVKSEERFKEINEAHEVLGDPEKRAKYDRLGARWEETGPPPGGGGPASGGGDREFHFGGTGFSDFFERYFSGGSRYGFPRDWEEMAETAAAEAGRPRRGHDIEGDILVTLEEAMRGTLRPISLQTIDRRTGEAQTHAVHVRIPPGATDGRRIRVPGQGEPGRHGGEPGDLYLRVRHAAHPEFTTMDADLLHDLDLAPWEAVLGAEIVVPTLDGAIRLKVPAGSANGQVLRVRGRGLPKPGSGERGDLRVALCVVLPPEPGPAERALWEQLQKESSFTPRA
jgi:curved DNA-binding protein